MFALFLMPVADKDKIVFLAPGKNIRDEILLEGSTPYV